MTNLNLPCEGGCCCGHVRIRIEAPPLLTMACHCAGLPTHDQQLFSLSAAIPVEGFSVTRGEPVIGGMHGATRHYFCSHCMSWIFTRPEGIDFFVNVRATMLDDPSWFVPFIETMTSEKLSKAATPATHSYERWPEIEEFGGLIKEYAAQVEEQATR